MKYLGIKFKKIIAEKFKEPEGTITINSNFNLKEVNKEESFKITTMPVFSFIFNYDLKYSDFATISFEGTVYIEIEDKNLAKELEKDKKIINTELRKFILEIVLAKTHVESLHLEEKLNLPFHIRSPKVNFEKK